MSARLSETELAQLPAGVSVPRYNRHDTGAGIVHLGVGAFHRAHQAWYTQQVLDEQGGHWGIIGASLRSPDVRDRLAPQDGLYTLVERDGTRETCRVIGALKEILVAPEDPEALLDRLAHPDVRVVSLTITEKGYFYDSGTGALRREDPDILEDLERFPHAPVTAIGYLAAGLARRRDADAGGVTLLSCDNLPHNGRVLRQVLTDFVKQADTSLLPWIERNVTFPCSMVDRIVPATTGADLERLESMLGVRDEAAVFTEPFCQWVIEDHFARGAPEWQNVGVLLTDDVSPFETMKLRLLNGSHSLIAYLGYLAGYDFVHQVMADPELSRLVRLYMDRQAQPTLEVPAGFDVDAYKEALCQRFANAALNHRTYQIAQDGSQKIPQRWLAVVRDLLALGRPAPVLALAVAGWIRYQEGRRDNGETFRVDDPLADSLSDRLQQAERAGTDKPAAVLAENAVFGDLAATHPDFASAVGDYYQRLIADGVANTVARVLADVEDPLPS